MPSHIAQTESSPLQSSLQFFLPFSRQHLPCTRESAPASTSLPLRSFGAHASLRDSVVILRGCKQPLRLRACPRGAAPALNLSAWKQRISGALRRQGRLPFHHMVKDWGWGGHRLKGHVNRASQITWTGPLRSPHSSHFFAFSWGANGKSE